MLDSMACNPLPTRAEVSDVANAVYDGADCLMLSGETAAGDYPLETVRMMGDIIRNAENFVQPELKRIVEVDAGRGTGRDAIAVAAKTAAEHLKAKAIIVLSNGGGTAKMIAKHRPNNLPIVCFVENLAVGRQLQMCYGCHPIVEVGHGRTQTYVEKCIEIGVLKTGDPYILVRGQLSDRGYQSILLAGVA